MTISNGKKNGSTSTSTNYQLPTTNYQAVPNTKREGMIYDISYLLSLVIVFCEQFGPFGEFIFLCVHANYLSICMWLAVVQVKHSCHNICRCEMDLRHY